MVVPSLEFWVYMIIIIIVYRIDYKTTHILEPEEGIKIVRTE